ncbi:MAG TPA: DUF4189 domain-containing protein [Methylovirgula sp.]
MVLKSSARTAAKIALIVGSSIALMGSVSQALADCTPGACYGAIATATWNDSSGAAYVASGIGWNYSTPDLAANGAVSQCQGYGGQGCTVVGTFANGGCGYVTTGTNANGVKWGVGATPQEALSQCQDGGYTCNPPAGGCTAGAQ